MKSQIDYAATRTGAGLSQSKCTQSKKGLSIGELSPECIKKNETAATENIGRIGTNALR